MITIPPNRPYKAEVGGSKPRGARPISRPMSCAFVHCGSPLCAMDRERADPSLTRENEPRRAMVNGLCSLAKVGVAGSNPVVRSKRKPSSESLFAFRTEFGYRFDPTKIPSISRLLCSLNKGFPPETLNESTVRVPSSSAGHHRNERGRLWRRPLWARLALVLWATFAVLLASLPASAYPRPGRTELVSVASDGGGANAISWAPSMSGDGGRYVAFHSSASNLVSGDTNGVQDVFVHDRQTGATERLSVASDGSQGNRSSSYPSISGDGRYVAFTSAASNLVSGQTARCSGQPCPDVFVHDRQTGVTERVSVASDGAEGNDGSAVPSISNDGRYVAFESVATNLVPDDLNGTLDVFVHDRAAGLTEKVSAASVDTGETGASHAASISADGRFVAFQSLASNLVPGDTNQNWDVFLQDRLTGEIDRVSRGVDGMQGNAGSQLGPPWTTNNVVSADGRYVAFHSMATNLVPGDTNGALDVFVRDRAAAMTERVSVGVGGVQGNGDASTPSLSTDGRYVAFHGPVSNLVAGDTNALSDAFVHDRATGVTHRVSVGTNAVQGTGNAFQPAISADGRLIAFYGLASNLVPGDTNGTHDVFVRDRGPEVGVADLSVNRDGNRVTLSGSATFSGQQIASATDPEGDGVSVAQVTARDVGAELIGARLIYRPEEEDISVRLRLASLPHLAVSTWPVPSNLVPPPSVGAGLPGIVYGVGFELGGVGYEVRALRVGGTASGPAAPYVALHRCAPTCAEVSRLAGSIGSTGVEVEVSVPLSALGDPGGETLQGTKAFAAVGEANSGSLAVLDDMNLPDGGLPRAKVELGIASAGTREESVVFDVEAGVVASTFSGTLDMSSLPPGAYETWARACLGDVCGPASRITVP